MILRKSHWILLGKFLWSVIIVKSQNARSFDANDWIPITPSPNANGGEFPNKAVGRVLNLDAPAQKIFPEDEISYRKRKPHVQQFLRENSFKSSNDRHKAHKTVNNYRFETPPHIRQNAPNLQYFTNQEVKLATYEKPPPLNQHKLVNKPVLTQEQAPAINAPNIYEQYNLPFNSSFYQSLNPTSINQELQNGFQAPSVAASVPINDEKQSVQLLYVPLENLKTNPQLTQIPQDSETIFHQVDAPRQQNQIFSQNKQHLIDDIEHDLIQQTVQAHRLQQQIHLGRPVVIQTTTTTTTTPKPTKRKPHQPPLAVYLENNGADIDDVLNALRDAKTIAVQDAVLPNSPQVFVGPSNLNLPSSYTRFPLPYINKLDGNRIERKIENLPFFVAPLSYKTPPGYSKIPLPSPHVGSVVVSNKEDSHKRAAPRPTSTYPNQISSYESTKPLYSAPSSNLNSQSFDPSQQSYYSTTSYLNPIGDIQKPQYLQFSVNNDVKQFEIPSKKQEQLQQSRPAANNIPQLTGTSINSYKNDAPAALYNSGNTAQSILQDVPGKNNSPYSSPLRSANENQNKYNLNQDQTTESYQIPSRTSTHVGDTTHETINSYQIPVKSSSGSTQYTQPIENKKEEYSFPHTFSDENSNSYHIPSRNSQRGHHPGTSEVLHNTGTPSRTTTSYYHEPSPSFLTSPFEKDHEVSITPKTTSTTKPATEESYRYPFSNNQKKQNPLDLAINQYELHQINSQLVEGNTEKTTKDPYDFNSHYHYDGKPKDFDYSSQFEVERSKVKGKYGYSSIFDVDIDGEEKPKYDYSSGFERYSSTPATILRDVFQEVTTTEKVSPKNRRRGKPTRQPTNTATTENPVQKESYTVLEEFSAKTATTPDSPKEIKYESEYKLPQQSEVADVPANVYRIRSTTQKYEQVKIDSNPTQYDNIKTVIEDIPAKVYNLKLNENTHMTTNPADQHGLNQNLKIEEKEVLHKDVVGIEEVSHAPTFEQSPLTEVFYSPKYNEDIKPLVHNRGQHQQERPYNFDSRQPDEADYTSNLQDQSVRTLLVPNILVPTTEHLQTPPSFEPLTVTSTTTTTTTTTTEKTSTLATRSKGRQRGGSRFSTASVTTVASAPRRNVNRRRPIHSSRTTSTESPSTQYSSREDIQKVNTRQRFRTRGRPSQTTEADRISSTENEVRSYKEPISQNPSETRTDTAIPQSYMKFEHTVEDQKLIIQPEDTPITDYPQYYSPQLPVTATENPRQVLQYDNTATTQNPIMDIQITHSVPKIRKQPIAVIRKNEEAQIHLQAGGVLHNNNNDNNNEEGNHRQASRVRGRTRSRTRVATTTTERPVVRSTARPVIRLAPKRTTTIGTTTTTTQKPKSAAEEEFFGFIRQPNFNQIYNIQGTPPTEQPLQVYQNQPSNTDVRVSTYQVFGNANKSPNVRVQSYQIPQNQQQADDVRLDFSSVPSDDTTVRFVGEIRPKYRPTTQNYEETATTEFTEPIKIETETPRSRTRGRVRGPQRKSNTRQSDNEVSTSRTQQATRRSNNVVRSRGRGTAQYRLPENLRKKEDKDADLEGENYPPSFFQSRQPATTNTPSFQISIGPSNEEDDNDQLTNPSLYQPKILPKPEEWTEATENTATGEEYAPANDVNGDISLEKETVQSDAYQVTEQPQRNMQDAVEQPRKEVNESQTSEEPIALPVTANPPQMTQNSDEAFKEDTKAMEELFEEVNKTEKPRKGKGRRRGVWKLIRQKPVTDTYEVAESQNYYSVLNAFGNIVKVNDKTNWYDRPKTDESSDLGHQELYNNYNPVLEQNSEVYDYESKKLPSTEFPEHQTTRYYEVYDLNAATENAVTEILSTIQPESQPSFNGTEPDIKVNTTTKASGIFDAIYEMFGVVDKMKETKEPAVTTTLSSTDPAEIHTNSPTVTTTVISPTFPEEITEVPTTIAPLDSVSTNSDVTIEEVTEKVESSTTPKTQITKSYEVEPWEMKAVRTSTSTEISHETEICYRGKCVKTTDRTGS